MFGATSLAGEEELTARDLEVQMLELHCFEWKISIVYDFS
jgi:hypothetical protein